MKLVPIFVFLLATMAVPQRALAIVATLGASSQTFALTGIGPNALGEGQSIMKWGTCTFDGTNTKCVLSGPFTGFGGGGNYSFIVTYAGSGRFPLNAITRPGSDLFFAQTVSPYTFEIILTPASGGPISFYSFANFNFLIVNPTCTGVST